MIPFQVIAVVSALLFHVVGVIAVVSVMTVLTVLTMILFQVFNCYIWSAVIAVILFHE